MFRRTQSIPQGGGHGPARAARPFVRRAALALGGVVLAGVPALAGWSVQMDGREHPLASRRFEGVEYLALSDIARAFGGQLRLDRLSGNVVYEIAGRRIVLSSREGLASLDARIHTLPHPNRLEGDELWVVPEFVDQLIVPIFDRPIQRLGTVFLVRGSPPIDVTFRSSHDAGGTRAVLEFSQRVPYDVETSPRGVRVRVLSGSIQDVDLPSRMEGDEVGSIRFEPTSRGRGGTFVFEPGPSFGGVRPSELESPFRVVLDFDRAGGAAIPSRGGDRSGRSTWQPTPPRGIRTVVLDPGHGGNETGAKGPTGLFEKDVVLDIAHRTARLLEDRLGVEALLTRQADQAIPLDERAAIANNRKGDLFVSIHANASHRPRASGAETYFLAYEPGDEESGRVARRENLGGGLPQGRASDPDRLEMVLWSMAQAEHLAESFQLAETIQQEFNVLLGTRDRGVRQAPFRVLTGAAMPAVLVEVAFITNAEEEASLRSSEFKGRIAEALVASISRYKRSYEERIGLSGGRRRGPAGGGGP